VSSSVSSRASAPLDACLDQFGRVYVFCASKIVSANSDASLSASSSRSISAQHNSFRPISFAFSLVVLKLIAQCLQPQCSPGSWDGVGTSDTEGDRCRSWLPEELWRDSRPCGRIGPRLRNNGALCPLCNQISVTWPYYRRTVVNRFMAGALNQSPMVGSCHVTVQSSASGATSGPNFG
jgi:hypothetical protein